MKNVCIFLAAMVVALAGCAQVDTAGEANATLAQRYADEIWSKGNLDVIDEVLAADFTRHNPPSFNPATVTGVEAMKKYVTEVRTRYPDFRLDIQYKWAAGDVVASTWTATGTHAETHKPLVGQGMSISRFADGKLVEEWSSWDTYGTAQQQGLIPTSGSEAR